MKPSLAAILGDIDPLDVDLSEEPISEYEGWCSYAISFYEGYKEVCKLTGLGALVQINQAKLLTADLHYKTVLNLPKAHRVRAGPRGHICVYHAYIRAYKELREEELKVEPPRLFIPPPPPPPPPAPVIQDTIIGLEE